MANVIEALVVTLGIDNTDYTKKQGETVTANKRLREDADKTAKDLEGQGKRAAQFFSQIKTEALSLMGILLGGKGLEAFTRDATTSLAALGREAKNIGIATPELAAFRMMIERNGGSADAAQQSFRNLTDEMERFKVFGQSSIIQYLTPIGAQRGDDAMTVYKKFVQFAESHKNDVPLINLIGKGLGFDQGSINEAMKGVKQVGLDMQESYRLGTPTPEMAANMAKLQHDWGAMTQAAEHLGHVVLNNLQPALSGLLTWTTGQIEQNPKMVVAIETATAAFTALSLVRISASLMGFTGLSTAVGGLLTLVTRLSQVMLAIGLIREAAHIGDLNTGEQEEIDRENAAHGESHPRGEPTGPTRDPFGSWMRQRVTAMPEGPVRHYLKERYGSDETADTSMTPEKSAFLRTLSDPESGGDYRVLNGGERVDDLSHHPNRVGKHGTSTAFGRYQFTHETWQEASSALGLPDAGPVSQDKAAWWRASKDYRAKTGRDLADDLKQGGHETDITGALKGRWPSLPGGSQQLRTQKEFNDSLARDMKAGVKVAASEPTSAASSPAASSPSSPAGRPELAGGSRLEPPPEEPNPAGRPGFDKSLTASPGERVASASPTNHTNTDISIGNVVINTPATDTKGIATDLHKELIKQSDRGLR